MHAYITLGITSLAFLLSWSYLYSIFKYLISGCHCPFTFYTKKFQLQPCVEITVVTHPAMLTFTVHKWI